MITNYLMFTVIISCKIIPTGAVTYWQLCLCFHFACMPDYIATAVCFRITCVPDDIAIAVCFHFACIPDDIAIAVCFHFACIPDDIAIAVCFHFACIPDDIAIAVCFHFACIPDDIAIAVCFHFAFMPDDIAVRLLPELRLRYENGLPVVAVPLPSRRADCLFTLRPISATVGEFIQHIQDEDRGVDKVAVYNTGDAALLILI